MNRLGIPKTNQDQRNEHKRGNEQIEKYRQDPVLPQAWTTVHKSKTFPGGQEALAKGWKSNLSPGFGCCSYHRLFHGRFFNHNVRNERKERLARSFRDGPWGAE